MVPKGGSCKLSVLWLWFILLVFPSVNYSIYYIVVILFLIFYSGLKPINASAWDAFVTLCSVFCLWALPKLLVFYSASDVNELAKLILFLFVIVIAKPKIKISEVKVVIFSIIFIDLLFAILQVIHYDGLWFERVNSYIHPQHHIEGSLNLASVRALGLFTDVAEHAAMIFLFYLFFLMLLNFKYCRYQSLFGVFLCVLIMLLAQSKTGLVVLFLSMPIAIYCLVKSFSFVNVFLLSLISVLFIVIYVSEDLLTNFEQIFFLLEYGSQVSSFGERKLIWSRVIFESLDTPHLLLIFGSGRGHLEAGGFQSSVFDNDFVYILNTFGLIGLMVFFMLYFLTLYKLYVNNSSYSVWLFYILIMFPAIGSGTDFLSSLKILVFIGLISANCKINLFGVSRISNSSPCFKN